MTVVLILRVPTLREAILANVKQAFMEPEKLALVCVNQLLCVATAFNISFRNGLLCW